MKLTMEEASKLGLRWSISNGCFFEHGKYVSKKDNLGEVIELEPICPMCHDEFPYFNYAYDIKEYGQIDFDGNQDSSDSDTDNTRYTCPECDEEFSDDFTC
jgi:hypothetical protein